MKSPDVIVAGDLFVDLIMSGFDIWPEPGQEAFAREFHHEIGGGAAITACGLATLGSRVAVLGVAGTDVKEWLVSRLKASGVDARHVRFDPSQPTAITVVATTPRDRAFLTYTGANRGLESALAGAADGGEFARARHVHLACAPNLNSAADLFKAIRSSGCTLSLDVGWHEEWLANPHAVSVLSLVDVFLPNESEARRMMGEEDAEECLRRFKEAGARQVVIKLGALGSAMLSDGRVLVARPPDVTTIDTTGAGDCFAAGFLHAWLRDDPAELCLRTGNACGALSTERFGGIAGFPAVDRVAAELEKYSCKR